MTSRKNRTPFRFPKKLGLTLMLVACLLFFTPSVVRMNNQQSKVDEEIASLKQEIAKAENRNSELKKMIDYLNSDSFLEEQARLSFNLKKPGEQVAVVAPAGSDLSLFQPASSTTQSAAGDKRNNYQRWLDYFFKPKA